MLTRFLFAMGFLTRLPVPCAVVEADVAGKATAYFPAVGLIIGALVTLAALAAAHIWHSSIVGAVAAVAANALVTGGLHLDGLMDTCDGIFGAHTRERTLEIMRDSRLGSFGTLGGALAVLIRYALSGGGGPAAWQGLLLAPVVGRCAQVWVVKWYPYARTAGMGHAFQGIARRQIGTALAIGSLACVVLAGWQGLAWLVAGLGCGWLVAWRLNRRLEGLTGDCYGTVTEITEWTVLATALLLPAGRLLF